MNSCNRFRPLTVASFKLNYHFVGENTYSFHCVNVALHSMTTFLVFQLAHHTFACNSGGMQEHSVMLAAISGLLFAVHPVHVEAVSNVTGRAEILSAFFALLAVYIHVTFYSTSEKNKTKGNGILYYVLSVIICCISCTLAVGATLAKESGVVTLPILFAYEMLQSGIFEKIFCLRKETKGVETSDTSTNLNKETSTKTELDNSQKDDSNTLAFPRLSIVKQCLILSCAILLVYIRLEVQGNMPLWDFRDVMR